MKILRVIASMNPAHGGPAQGIRNSIPALERLGIHNEVVCFDLPTESFLKRDPFVIYAIGPSRSPYGYCSKLHSWLKDNLHQFDAVIIHGLWLYNSFGTYRVWKTIKKQNGSAPKLFVMPHGMLDPYFQKAANRKLKAIRNWLFWWLVERRVVNSADGILFTCEQELLLARQTFGRYQPRKELNVSYGIPPAPSNSAKLIHEFQLVCGIQFNQPYWLFLSRVHEKKGTDLLIKAYQKLLSETGALPSLVIAGPGLDTAYGKAMVELAKPTPEIQFAGMLTGDAKWGALHGCELFVLPSHQENFGIAVVEALACGKPVLISKQVNIWQEINHENAGLIDEDTPEGVLRLLTDWSNLSNEARTLMGERAKATYRNYFTIEQAAKRMAQVLVNG